MEEEKAISELFQTIMEDYSDSVIPPLSHLCSLPETTTTTSTRFRCRKAQLPQERIPMEDGAMVEQQRRKKAAELYQVLRTMVPTVQHKPSSSQATVVMETVNYIRELEEKLAKMEAAKRASSVEAPTLMVAKSSTHQNSNSSSSVEVMVSGDIAFFGIESVTQKGFAVKALMRVLENHQAEVLAANINANEHKTTLTITALVKKINGDVVQRIRKDLLAVLS